MNAELYTKIYFLTSLYRDSARKLPISIVEMNCCHTYMLIANVVLSSMSMSIRMKKETIEELKRLKIHPRETYDDVIKRLIATWKEQTPS